MNKTIVLLAFLALLVSMAAAQADSSNDWNKGNMKADKCFFDKEGKKCCIDCKEKCFLVVKCDRCGEQHRCDCYCDKCGEKCKFQKFCDNCKMTYDSQTFDGKCDRCGKDCYWIKKCDKCGDEYNFDGLCGNCGERLHYDKCCYDFCDKYCYEYMDKCKEHCPSCDVITKRYEASERNGDDYQPQSMMGEA